MPLEDVAEGAEADAPITAVWAEVTASGAAHQGQKRPAPLCSREQMEHLTKGKRFSLS